MLPRVTAQGPAHLINLARAHSPDPTNDAEGSLRLSLLSSPSSSDLTARPQHLDVAIKT